MRNVFVLAVLFVSVGAAYAASSLLEEFNRRDIIKLTQEQGNAINFMKAMGYAVEKIEQIEVLDDNGTFVTRDRDDIICLGNASTSMMRCKNKAGITTVMYQGDSD